MKKNQSASSNFKLHSLASAALVLVVTSAVHAAPMSFGQVPAGSTAREPAPNIIISVDDSGSMGWDINGCRTTDYLSAVYGAMDDPARTATSPACVTPNPTPSRLANLRSAVRATFGNPATGDRGIIPDDRIRLAWQALDDRNFGARAGAMSFDQDSITAGQLNSLRPFTGAHRTNFDAFMSSLTASSLVGTSLHRMMSNANTYMSTPLGINSPFAANPGTTRLPELSCRRSYHILMTDGAWNLEDTTPAVAGNVDGTARVLPDGTSYQLNHETRVYRDEFGGTKGTIADWAMLNWATDFQTGLTNDVRALRPVTTPETFGGVALSPYWNPRNNPQTWQGLTQYTIGFGNSATQWGGAPAWDSVNDDNLGGDFPNLVNGTASWLDLFDGINDNTERPSDLWHAALNGRGNYYPARTAADLQTAFQDILSNILAQTSRPLVSITGSSSRLSNGGFNYVAKYNSDGWSGDLAAFSISSTTGLPSVTPTWVASNLIDSTNTSVFDPSTRVVLTHNGASGVGFKWSHLSSSQRTALRGSETDTVGSQRVDYLRGDRTMERSQAGGIFRNRDSRLGDIVNSNIWYTGKALPMGTEYEGHKAFRTARASRTPMLYVGANDGMLHGFNASTGREMLAYVPRGVYANLRSYTLADYDHKYFVDGNPFTGDANLSGGASGWRTVLVGALGAGGKGYFILDVTDPGSFTDPGAGSSALVLKDQTEPSDGDIGHIFSAPTVDNQSRTISQQIVKLNNGRWAVVMGNGYNSTNERPVLLIQYLDGTRSIKKLIASSATGQTNGLGTPRLFDVDGNGTMDVAYAGDLRGNLWKFNLVTTSDTGWGVSAWSGDSVCSGSSCQPLYQAQNASGTAQPIMAAPLVLVHPLGGLQVLFGTGKDLEISDRNATYQPTQTTYSVWDKTLIMVNSTTGVLTTDGTGARISNGRSSLVAQSTTGTNSDGIVSTSNNEVAYSRTDTNADRGWYFDMPVSSERVLSNPIYFGATSALINSVVPAITTIGETCDLSSASDRGYITVLDAISGSPSSTPLFGDSDAALASATRTEFGGGEFAAQDDFQDGTTTLIAPDATCFGTDCSGSNALAACVRDSGCTGGPVCTVGVDCPGTYCSGSGCSCNGKICEQGPSGAFNCTGPNCRPNNCGVVVPGALIDLCIPGLFGARTDWRELR